MALKYLKADRKEATNVARKGFVSSKFEFENLLTTTMIVLWQRRRY